MDKPVKLIAILLTISLSAIITSCGSATTSSLNPTKKNTVKNQSAKILSSDGEAMPDATHRLFKEAYKSVIEVTEEPEVVEGATVGTPRAVAKDYNCPGPILIEYVVSDDVRSAKTGLFEAMKPARLSDRSFIVPMIKNNRAVCEFDLYIDKEGKWSCGGITGPLPAGKTHDIEQATIKLKKTLGQTTKTRVALLLPAGLVFAVGRNGSREAAVYLTFINHGAGYKGFNKVLPETGQLFNIVQLTALLTP